MHTAGVHVQHSYTLGWRPAPAAVSLTRHPSEPCFPAERRGLVSLEAKKRSGHYTFKLLAVDVPAYGGGEQRIYIEGGPSVYERGGVLNELRDPFIRVGVAVAVGGVGGR